MGLASFNRMRREAAVKLAKSGNDKTDEWREGQDYSQLKADELKAILTEKGVEFDSFSLNFDNNMQVQRCIGTGTPFAGANIPTTFTPSGSITLSWSKAAWEIWKKTLTGETIPFEFTLQNAEGGYTFLFPAVQVDGDWPDGGNTDVIQVQLNITAADTPPTITRIPPVKPDGK